jgi:queuosine biosynthesis protein QueC
MAKADGFRLFALTVSYGQRHARELEAARAVAAALGVARHIELDVDLSAFGGSSLTTNAPVPRDRPIDPAEIPSTYVPARNTVFLALALGWTEVLEAQDIFIGVNALDYSGYPDCRPEFIAAFERLAALGTAKGVNALSSTCTSSNAHERRDYSSGDGAGARLRVDPQLLRPRSARTAVPALRQLHTSCGGVCTGRHPRSGAGPMTTPDPC